METEGVYSAVRTESANKIQVKSDVHMSVHRKYISKVQPARRNVFSVYLFL
jgi:hypothetical protein